ncbi:hypothetical protein JCM11251_005610 [Rhodosporidiobolus azoricus]
MPTPPTPPSPLGRHRLFSPTAGLRVSPLCLGTMTFGTYNSETYGKCDKETAFKIMDTFVEKGGNFLDTANTYRAGESEEWIGEWMQQRENREELVIATKYTNSYHVKGPQSTYIGNNVKSMKRSVEVSLERLRTNYIDILYVHAWDFSTSIPELMCGLNDLVASGKVMYLGISDTPAWVVTKANQYARDHALRQFVVYQGMWSAVMRDFEREIIPMALDEGMALCPYGALNQGRFQTREGFAEREKGDHDGRNMIQTSQRDKDVSAVLEDLANARNDDTTLLNIALAYVLQKAPYVFPIIGGRKVEHLEGNIPALDVVLTDKEISTIENAYEFEHGFVADFLGGALFDPKKPHKMVSGPADVWLTNDPVTMDYVEGPKAIQARK